MVVVLEEVEVVEVVLLIVVAVLLAGVAVEVVVYIKTK